MKEYGVVENPTRSEKLRHPERVMGPMTEEQADRWVSDKSGDYSKVVRSVSEWYIPRPPVDFSVSQEEADSMDHIVIQAENGYKKHAFQMTDKIRDALVSEGLGKYYGSLRLGGPLFPLCKNLKRNVWNRQGIPLRGDITELDNETFTNYEGTIFNTVCTDCQRKVREMREADG